MKKTLFILSLLMVFLTSFACAQNYTGKVISVTDSNNISVMKDNSATTVRLNCAACPAAGQSFAPEAQKFLQDLILNKTVEVRVVWMDYDKRQVSLVLLDGKNVGALIAGAGLAWYDGRHRKDGEIAAAQAEAQAKQLAIWSEPDPVAPWAFLTDQRGIVPNTSGPMTHAGGKGYGAPSAGGGGYAGNTSVSNQAPPTGVGPSGGYGCGYDYAGAWCNAGRGAVVQAQSNRGAASRGGGGRR
ncbi:MAG: thermonuclease family protein [Vulcanimicrobiota bacterium]